MPLDMNSLRGRAMLEYGRIILWRLDEGHFYRLWPLRILLQLKLESLFGNEYVIETAKGVKAGEVEAVIEGLRFIGLWCPEGIFQVSLLAACPNCESRMVSEPLLSLTDLGRELTRLEMTGSLGCHRCQEVSATLR